MNRMISVATPTSITGITFLCINISKLMCKTVYRFTYLKDPEFLPSTEIKNVFWFLFVYYDLM